MKKEKFKIKREKGITLVALVITIIILLILAGISISALTNTGLFGKAKEAKEKTKEAEENQAKTLSEYETALNQYSENTLVYKVNNGTIKVGDYIKYTPNTEKNDEKYKTLISNLKTYSGTSDNTELTLNQDKLDWRVLDVKNGHVRLISAEPTTSTVTLNGYNGYNNAVKLLDDSCSTLYNNSKLASKVQSLKIEDIQDKMVEKDYTKIVSSYGKRFTPDNKFYPSILLKEEEQKVTADGKTITGTELNISEQNELINQKNKFKAEELDVKYTYWYKNMAANDFDGENKETYYNLFINSGSSWMSSRCIDDYSGNAVFRIRFVDSGGVFSKDLYYSGGGEGPRICALRPVITLNSNVQLDSANTGNGSSAGQAYAIK